MRRHEEDEMTQRNIERLKAEAHTAVTPIEEEPIPGPDVDPVEQLAHLVPALWRTLKRASQSAQQLPANESQVTILRMLLLHGDLKPAQLADYLYIARPTVSNLLKELVASGLVERRIAAHDARSVVISATDRGRSVLSEFRSDRVAVLRESLTMLPEEEQDRISSCVPALRQLLRQLEATAASDLPDTQSA